MSPASGNAGPQPDEVVAKSNHDALCREDRSRHTSVHDTTQASDVPDVSPIQTTKESTNTLEAYIDTIENLVTTFVDDVDELQKQAVALNADLDAMLGLERTKK